MTAHALMHRAGYRFVSLEGENSYADFGRHAGVMAGESGLR